MTQTRRAFLGSLAAAAASCAAPSSTGSRYKAHRGNINQSVAGWCFMNQGPRWDVETLAANARMLGCEALELVDPEHWGVLRGHGLICAATKSHTFVRGMNNRDHWDECVPKLREAIEVTGKADYPNVMTFTGFVDTTEQGGSRVEPDQGIANCVEGYGKVVGLAEQHDVQLILEPLNTRDPAPMKGHPGYHGDHIDECIEIIRRVGSPALRLLFDVYHIQIMDGDLIRRIEQHAELIGHVQIAGCPGRGPLDANQEIQYPAVMRALVKAGYRGYVGHEWIATGDALTQLENAVATCDV